MSTNTSDLFEEVPEEPPEFAAEFNREIQSAAPHPVPLQATGLLANLNPEQLAAVTLPNAHALILAGAGSGKTRVLTTRIAWLLHNQHVSPGGVLAVTFTNKAAKEMLTRLGAMLPYAVRGMWVGTFHGLCNRFLRAHWKQANLPQSFQILDSQDQLSAIKRLLKAHSIDDERQPPKELMWFINGCKENAERAKDVAVHDAMSRQKAELYKLYEDQCQREGVVDFAELLLRTYELMRDNLPLREHYQRRFRHVLVDEFQDTNKLQYAWLKLFGGGADTAVLAVGDDDQSIYAFRGAQVGNMREFVREFNVAHQIKLEQNYRSHGNILDSANHLIGHNKNRLGKNLSTQAGPGEPVRVYEAPSDFAEADWLIDEAKQLMRGTLVEGASVRASEIAVLYRSNAQSRVLETALFNAGIPYRVYGGLRFFERAEIKHALAYLRLLENIHDDTSMLRVINFPPRGIGARSIEQLQDAAKVSGCSLADAATAVTGKAGGKLTEFIAFIEVLREQTVGLSLKQITELVLDKSTLLEHYRAEKDGQDRIENLNELVNAAESFVTIEGFGKDAVALPEGQAGLTQSPVSQGLDPNTAVDDDLFEATGEVMSPLAAFLSHAALESGDNQAQAGQEALQLMTVHAAKGLEFDCVFITGLEEGLFPHENAMSDVQGLEEERRLMYVAITRARKRLYLCHAQTRMLHGQTRYNISSRFLDELPEPALRRLSPKREARSLGGFGSANPFASNSIARNAHYSLGNSTKASTFSDGLPVRHVVEAPSASGDAIRAGLKVFHTKFGEGKVLSVEGQGADARAQVNFNRHGTKWLALSVAKLTVV
jgi:DNA helicase II / ATP-dependent DNA helicase PcrA